VTVLVPAINQFRWQNALFFVDPEVLCNFELLSSDNSEMENAIQLQGALDLSKKEAYTEVETHFRSLQRIHLCPGLTRIEHEYCYISTSYLAGLFDTFILL